MTLAFFCPGIPSTKGSAKAFVVRGRAIVTNDAGPKAKAWAAVIAAHALEAMGGRAPLDGAVEVEAIFHLPRPKAHSTKAGFRPNAPAWSSSKPDADKLARCALDALTGIVLTDDARIARLTVEKRYADGPCGVAINVRALDYSAGDTPMRQAPGTSDGPPSAQPQGPGRTRGAPAPHTRSAHNDRAAPQPEAAAQSAVSGSDSH